MSIYVPMSPPHGYREVAKRFTWRNENGFTVGRDPETIDMLVKIVPHPRRPRGGGRIHVFWKDRMMEDWSYRGNSTDLERCGLACSLLRSLWRIPLLALHSECRFMCSEGDVPDREGRNT